jgi:hypothetical protein
LNNAFTVRAWAGEPGTGLQGTPIQCCHFYESIICLNKRFDGLYLVDYCQLMKCALVVCRCNWLYFLFHALLVKKL